VKLDEIFEPIKEELILVKAELNKIVNELEESPAKIIFEHYFKNPGKLLRPSLLLLSAAAADIDEYNAAKHKLVKAAAAIELVHNASLIHDDIVDKEMSRRGQKTINNIFGNKIAVMAGNALFARAISILLDNISIEAAKKIIQMVRKMSTTEIRQLNRGDGSGSREDYLELIEGKTALLMSNSCMLGASIVTYDNDKISAFQQFGLNFGMAYQIVDDIIDQEAMASRYVTIDTAKKYSKIAVSSIKDFEASVHQKALKGMLKYILSLTHINAETKIKSRK
jgi:octaprenyl-diphosphate synthase